MARDPRPLPPLNSIRAFEVAARHLNLSRAAEELGVTPGAISKQVIALEDFIGAQLFERHPDGLALTLEGRELAESISPAFEMLGNAFNRFSRRPPRSNVFRLTTVASFASQVITPRLDAFQTHLPHVALEILTSDRLLDFDREEIDLSIRFGAGQWDGLVSSELVKGTLVPVCAPTVLDRNAGDDPASIISSTRLIQVFPKNEWRKWEEATGIKLSQTESPFVMEHFLVAMQAVLTGQGVALLPEILVRDHLANGGMKQFSAPIDWHHTFYFAHPPNVERQPVIRDVLTWFRTELASDS